MFLAPSHLAQHNCKYTFTHQCQNPVLRTILNKHVEAGVCYMTNLYIVVIDYELMNLTLLAPLSVTAILSGSITSQIYVVPPLLHDLQVKPSLRDPGFYTNKLAVPRTTQVDVDVQIQCTASQICVKYPGTVFAII